jgi:hypothetical protein
MFAAIAEADSWHQLDKILMRAQQCWAADEISTGTMEAAAHRCHARSNEIPEGALKPLPTKKQHTTAKDISDRAQWEINKLRWNAGVGRTGVIR